VKGQTRLKDTAGTVGATPLGVYSVSVGYVLGQRQFCRGIVCEAERRGLSKNSTGDAVQKVASAKIILP